MTNPTPPGQVPDALPAIQRFEVVDCIDSKHVPAVIPKPHGPWVRYEDHAAALCRLHTENEALRAQQDDAYDHGPQAETVEEAARDVGKWLNERPNRPLDLRHVAMLTHHAKRTAHVQNPAEIEHVAGDVSKNGAEVNMSTQQPAPAGFVPVAAFDRLHAHAESLAARLMAAPPQKEVQEPYGWLYDWTHSSATGKPDTTCTGFTKDEAHARKHDNCIAVFTTPQPAPAGAADTKTLELLSTTVGLLMGYREGGARQPYKPGSVVAKVVDEVVDHLKDWPTPQPSPTAQAAESAVLKAIREANMQLVRTGDNAFILVPYKVATAQAAESVPAPVLDSLLNIVIQHEARATPEEVRSMAAELATYRAARAPAESVGRDALNRLLKAAAEMVETVECYDPDTLLALDEDPHPPSTINASSDNLKHAIVSIRAAMAANGGNK